MKIISELFLAFALFIGGGAWLCDYIYISVKKAALEQIQKPMTPLSTIATGLTGKKVDTSSSKKLLTSAKN